MPWRGTLKRSSEEPREQYGQSLIILDNAQSDVGELVCEYAHGVALSGLVVVTTIKPLCNRNHIDKLLITQVQVTSKAPKSRPMV